MRCPSWLCRSSSLPLYLFLYFKNLYFSTISLSSTFSFTFLPPFLLRFGSFTFISSIYARWQNR
ncbi:hypothetical protein CPB83DRAFT_851350 [Crepidotus variabilis]|uniref:Uncharacterized protein n=1 Tax=Crepidotus variabilis TaxID=179855 RepID=A0A9P6EII1_9AGAR|nr:hypothetical protein CPB83DRAFT_851350 [Crepidotus variabilis]